MLTAYRHSRLPSLHQRLQQLVSVDGPASPPGLLRVQHLARLPPHHGCLVPHQGACQPIPVLAVFSGSFHHHLQSDSVCNRSSRHQSWWNRALALHLPLPRRPYPSRRCLQLLDPRLAPGCPMADRGREEDGVSAFKADHPSNRTC